MLFYWPDFDFLFCPGVDQKDEVLGKCLQVNPWGQSYWSTSSATRFQKASPGTPWGVLFAASTLLYLVRHLLPLSYWKECLYECRGWYCCGTSGNRGCILFKRIANGQIAL
ncbi:hypothetical protein AVEN_124076-1 [Araneus ventricosus]|uniref:Uncharacterized protein n=1 Tax=Araneus ventricosus TaxID=182803 RepID=A0A4Y2QNQ7_ARAVE|nr:hypothetical protein AVEN_124076-1 [Araneus ventricosus]